MSSKHLEHLNLEQQFKHLDYKLCVVILYAQMYWFSNNVKVQLTGYD